MKKIVFTIALLAILGAASYASTSKGDNGNPNYKHQSGESAANKHKNSHHTHIQVPFNHYSI